MPIVPLPPAPVHGLGSSRPWRAEETEVLPLLYVSQQAVGLAQDESLETQAWPSWVLQQEPGRVLRRAEEAEMQGRLKQSRSLFYEFS